MDKLLIARNIIKDNGIIEVYPGKKDKAGFTYIQYILTRKVRRNLSIKEKEWFKLFKKQVNPKL